MSRRVGADSVSVRFAGAGFVGALGDGDLSDEVAGSGIGEVFDVLGVGADDETLLGAIATGGPGC
ncbi:hypothetical protein ACSDQ9_14260 [Aestuariimicrobium soli]|uniref:hypothetical protein n=1 Tax=Aestuariimicrobium soli TaxID=2035834 RepID=UPI003EB95895